jgi:hypothetical protein
MWQEQRRRPINRLAPTAPRVAEIQPGLLTTLVPILRLQLRQQANPLVQPEQHPAGRAQPGLPIFPLAVMQQGRLPQDFQVAFKARPVAVVPTVNTLRVLMQPAQPQLEIRVVRLAQQGHLLTDLPIIVIPLVLIRLALQQVCHLVHKELRVVLQLLPGLP